ncbi:hypothetical protein [Rathayibacter sp. AY1A7]|uniref:hypothetical protein n=1 Tax=Rathayibacter sp. AY1A7 TaxID=2080524 RepID=UPI000CE76156|nr:hypothetical protein [Rathayibacter sp. AY1A7]PPF21031.1 hypothetical protein C5B95_06370 [Rathayibacter sp. AY1A7]
MFDVSRSRELTAVVLTLKTADRETRREMQAAARKATNSLWKPALDQRSTTRLERKVLVTGARSKTSSEGFSMLAATSRRPLSGGLVPVDSWAGVEFGMTPRKQPVTMSGRESDDRAAVLSGTTYTVQRTVGKQFKARRQTGYVVYPARREVGPKIVAAWARAIIGVAVKAVSPRG